MLMEIAKARGLKLMEGEVLAENQPMLSLVRRMGFNARLNPESPDVYSVWKEL
jgi:acetyltransferase